MGSGLSSAASRRWRARKQETPPHAESSRVLFLLYLIHRTWNIVIEHVDSKNARRRNSHTVPSSGEGLAHRFDSISLADSDLGSCYSDCSCSYCRLRECAHDCVRAMRTYKRKTGRAKTPKDIIEKACHEAIFDDKTIISVAQQYDIPNKTFHCKNRRNGRKRKATIYTENLMEIKMQQKCKETYKKKKMMKNSVSKPNKKGNGKSTLPIEKRRKKTDLSAESDVEY